MSFSPDSDLNLQHLQAELQRIDVLVRREIRRCQLAGQDPGDAFRGLCVSDAQANALSERPLCTSWAHLVALEPGEAQAFVEAEQQAVQRSRLIAQAIRRQGQIPRLEQLAAAFGLDPFDLDVLLICLAPALDLRYERLYGYLQDDVTRKRPSVNLILDLLCAPGPQRLLMLKHWADDAPLIKYQLLERLNEPGPKLPLLNQTLHIDDSIVSWLLGKYQPHPELGAHATWLWPDRNETDELLVADLQAELDRAAIGCPVIVFHGPDHASQQAAARQIAVRLGRSLLWVNLSAATAELSPLRALKLALRDARLTGAVPYLAGWDVCLTPDSMPQPDVFAELCAYPDLVIISGRAAWRPGGIERDRNLLWLEFPVPAYTHRRNLWVHFLGPSCDLAEQEIDALAGQFLLTASQIRDAVATAKDAAIQGGGALQMAGLFAAARAHSTPGLASLARKITPRYSWEDIVLPPDQIAMLRELVATVRGRPLVLEAWGVGKKLMSSNGVTALFAGPPGTGKTMAAEVIASELGLDIYKIDLSSVVSKYIGETEKNLSRIFDEAERSNAILFFDEADALFGKRSEVRDSHDRYANIEISYLLQRMEAYDGVTILATNLRANLDEAFTRRLQFAIDFPFPDETYRLRIWQALFPPDVPRASDLDLALMAHKFKLAGGNIRNIIVSAAFLAAADGGAVTMDHLLHGARRELQKMGRLVGESALDVY